MTTLGNTFFSVDILTARTDPRQQFTESMTATTKQHHEMTRIAGRISAVLLAAEKLELSTGELMEAPEANRGSLSTSVRTLMLHGLDAVRGIHPGAEARLQEYHDFMVFFHNEYKELTERRNNRPKKGKKR